MANKRSLGFSSTVFRKKFRAGMTVRNYRDNEIIFSQGDKADAVFYIQSGTVKLTMAATRRKKAIIAVLLRGSFFGEGCLEGNLCGCTRRDQLGLPISLACGRRARFARSSATRSLQALFNAYLLSRVIRVEEDLADQFFNFSEKRLARVLVVVWANNQGIKTGEPPEGEPSNPRGDGWYYPRKGK